MNMKAQPSIVMTCVALVLASARTGAQQPIPPATASHQQETLSPSERRSAINGALARLADPTMRSVSSGPAPTLILEASSTSRIAGARIGFQYRDWLLDMKLQGIVDGRARQAVFADLDGLRHKSTAELGVFWTSYPRRIASERLEAACRDYEKAEKPILQRRPCLIRELRRKARGEDFPASDPDQPRLADEVTRWLAPRRLFLAGVSYTFGPEQFSFVPTPTAASTTQTRVNWAVSARAGLVASDTLSLGAEYARVAGYGAGDNRQICVPIGDAGVLECSDKVVGGPTRLRSHIATLELRKLVGSKFAVNPRLSLNPSSGGVRFEVPVYFLRNGKGGLAGGVTLGWRHSRTAASTVEMTAFVGQVFGLILK